jgi:hypothetical protein
MMFLEIFGYQSADSSRFGLSQNFYLIIIEIDLVEGYVLKLCPSKLIHLCSLLYTYHLILLSTIWAERFVPNKQTTSFMHKLPDRCGLEGTRYICKTNNQTNHTLWCHNTCNVNKPALQVAQHLEWGWYRLLFLIRHLYLVDVIWWGSKKKH